MTARGRRNLLTLCTEVKALVESGQLHQFDAEWIGGLQQLPAAEKMLYGNRLVDQSCR